MKKILIIAGEVSGDLHGGNLVKAMKELDRSIQFFGIGGDNMNANGVELIYHINSISFMGFVEIVKHIPFLRKVKKNILNLVDRSDIDAAILIDYPGFNLSLAKELYKRKKKIFYYISPQLWAWGRSRINLIKKLIHKMIVVFPFEEKMYREAGIESIFVGHPLIDVISSYKFESKEDFFRNNCLDFNKKLLTIFPGSREQEIKKILPIVSEAINLIFREFDINAVVSGVRSIEMNLYRKYLGQKIPVILNKNYELMKYADAGIIKSGTSTLEAALFELPFVVVYKTSLLSYLIGKNLIQIDNISLANIVAGEKIVNELIQNECTPEKIYNEIKELLTNNSKIELMQLKMRRIKEILGESGASQKAAKIILSDLQNE